MDRSVARISLFVLGSLSLTGVAQADELTWTHYGLRPLAMGNAYVAVADDYNALFYNPAGLARLKEWDGEFLNPSVEVSANSVKVVKDVLALSFDDTDAVLDFLESNTGKSQHAKIGWTPHLIFPGFGFGIGAELNTTLAVHRDISVDVDVGPRVIMPIAFATNFLEDRLSVGGSVKMVARGGVDREFSINDIQAFSKSEETADGAASEDTPELEDYVTGGIGAGADVGILFTPIKTMEPTLGVSITDVGGTPYSKQLDIGGNALGKPDTRLPSVNTGVSLKPWAANGMYLRTSMDAHSINQPVHYSKKFNLGAEWGFGSIIKVQTGLHQGEMSGGFEFDVFLFTLRFVTYTEQLGAVAGEDDNLRDRRYALQLKLLI